MSTSQPTLDRDLAAALRAELVQTVSATRADQDHGSTTVDRAGGPQDTPGTVVPLTPRRRSRRTATRLALVAASVAGLAIGVSVLAPGQSAYAGWSATPTPVGGERAETATQECADMLDAHPPGEEAPTAPTWSTGLVEQRGRWLTTIVRGDDGTVGMCMHTLPSTGSATGSRSLPATPAAGSVTVLDDIGVFDVVSSNPMVANGWFGEPEMEGHHIISGVADDAVTSIVLHTEAGEVTASLVDGLWAAWWPVDHEPATDTRATGATLTLTDGSTVELDREALEELRDLGD